MLRIESASLDTRIIDAQLQVEHGQWWALIGPNGSGKSSLLSLAAGLEQATSGNLIFNNANYKEISLATFAAQRCLASQSYLTEFGIRVHEILTFFTRLTAIPAQIEAHLDIQSLFAASFDKLSGGEKQRVHLARNLMQIWPAIEKGQALVLLDEPLQQMDVAYQVKVLKLLQNIQSMGNAIVMSHHDLNQVMQYCSHVCLLQRGRVVNSGLLGDIINVTAVEQLFSQRFKLVVDESSAMEYFMPE